MNPEQTSFPQMTTASEARQSGDGAARPEGQGPVTCNRYAQIFAETRQPSHPRHIDGGLGQLSPHIDAAQSKAEFRPTFVADCGRFARPSRAAAVPLLSSTIL